MSGDVLRRLNPYAVALRYEGTETVWMKEADAFVIMKTLHDWANAEIKGCEK